MAAPANYRALVEATGIAYAEIFAPNDQPFSRTVKFAGVDYTTATIAGDVRALPDLAAAPISALTIGAPTLVGADTWVEISLSEAQIEALGLPAEPGAAIELYYRLQVTPLGGAKGTRLAGTFTRLGS